MIKVRHFTNKQMDEMVGPQLGAKLWITGMMNELRRYPNEIPCEENEIPSMIIPFASGPEKVEWGFTAGMSCLSRNEDGSVEVRNAEHFPSCALLALLSLLYDAGVTAGKKVSVTLSVPETAETKAFRDLLQEAKAKVTNAEIVTRMSDPTPKPSVPRRSGLDISNGMLVVQSLQQIDIGRFVAKVTNVNGQFRVHDDMTVTDGKFNVLQEHCPLMQIVSADNKVVQDSSELGTKVFFVNFAMWFPKDTPAFDGLVLVKEAETPHFEPRKMPPAITLEAEKKKGFFERLFGKK